MRELQRKYDHDMKLKQFYAFKSSQRVNAELEAREANRKQAHQELSDKRIADMQDIMSEIQVGLELFPMVTDNSARYIIFTS